MSDGRDAAGRPSAETRTTRAKADALIPHLSLIMRGSRTTPHAPSGPPAMPRFRYRSHSTKKPPPSPPSARAPASNMHCKRHLDVVAVVSPSTSGPHPRPLCPRKPTDLTPYSEDDGDGFDYAGSSIYHDYTVHCDGQNRNRHRRHGQRVRPGPTRPERLRSTSPAQQPHRHDGVVGGETAAVGSAKRPWQRCKR